MGPLTVKKSTWENRHMTVNTQTTLSAQSEHGFHSLVVIFVLISKYINK